jgi:hypothetical protein
VTRRYGVRVCGGGGGSQYVTGRAAKAARARRDIVPGRAKHCAMSAAICPALTRRTVQGCINDASCQG